jgi:hypothetical protein
MERGTEIVEGEVAPAMQGLTGDMSALGGATDDVRNSIDTLHSALTETFYEDLSYREAVRATEERIDGLKQAAFEAFTVIDDPETVVDEAAAAQRNLAGAIDDATSSALRQADQAVKTAAQQAILAGTTLSAEEKHRIYREELERVRDALEPGHPLRANLDNYIGQLNTVPSNVETQVAVNWVERVRQALPWGGGTKSGRATGGEVRPGRSYIVGEEEPEILEMGASGGRIVPGSRTRDRRGGSDSTTVINIHVTGAVVGSKRELGRAVAEALNAYTATNPRALRS